MAASDEFIPTRQSLLVRLKNWEDQASWKACFETCWRLTYAAATYWDARPGARSNRASQPEEAARAIDELRNRLPGVLEGEELRIRRKTGGVTELQQEGRWIGGQQLWWRDAKPGDTLELVLPVAQSGRYRIVMHNTRAFDCGIFQFRLDGEKLGKPLDLYSRENINRAVTLGTLDLKAGDHVFAAEIVGSNPAATPRHMQGLDLRSNSGLGANGLKNLPVRCVCLEEQRDATRGSTASPVDCGPAIGTFRCWMPQRRRAVFVVAAREHLLPAMNRKSEIRSSKRETSSNPSTRNHSETPSTNRAGWVRPFLFGTLRLVSDLGFRASDFGLKASLLSILTALLVTASGTARGADAQKIGGVDTSRWRGFNLLEKFTSGRNAPFVEDDFKWIAELGFNFVRLPMDYRCYVEKDDWLKFKESALKEIDQAIEFGGRYRIHVCLNLHRAPGFCINPPAEATDLWTSEEALNAFVAHWVMFARRYRQVPSERLSFNPLNEPTRNTRENYLKVFTRTIEAIQKEDPQRLIIVDGNNVGQDPIPEFLRYSNVIQATRGYHPGTISHYKANWVRGSDQWSEPTWPPVKLAGHLYGPAKPDLRSPLVLQGDFKPGTEIALKVNQLSVKARIVAKADGKVVAERTFDPQASPGEWKPVKSESPWTYHQPVNELVFKVTLANATREFTLENAEGDWLKFSELSFRLPDSLPRTYATDLTWGRKQGAHRMAADGSLLPPPGVAPDQTLVEYLKPWRDISANGETVFVGEWGCFNKTPHPVALAWMKSWLEQWKQARFGWALWNFRGSFGILDSDRTDVKYEDWHGHKLDREMLRLLQDYQKY